MRTLKGSDITAYKKIRLNTFYKGKPISTSTVRRELSVLSAMINYANLEWEWNLPNPVKGRKPPPGKHVIAWLTKAEASKLLEFLRHGIEHHDCADFVELAINTGLRKMELLALELDRIDLEHSVIHLTPEHQKNGSYSTVPMNATVKEIVLDRLQRLKDEELCTPWLFPNRQTQGSKHLCDLRKPFNKGCLYIGRPGIRIHDLRHTFASWLVQDGVPLYEVKELLRHESIETTEKYAHLAPMETARHVDRINTRKPHTMPHIEPNEKRRP